MTHNESRPPGKVDRPPRRSSMLSVPDNWWDDVDWWADPRLSYAKGLSDGYSAGRADQDDDDDQAHREAMRKVIKTIEQVDHRAGVAA